MEGEELVHAGEVLALDDELDAPLGLVRLVLDDCVEPPHDQLAFLHLVGVLHACDGQVLAQLLNEAAAEVLRGLGEDLLDLLALLAAHLLHDLGPVLRCDAGEEAEHAQVPHDHAEGAEDAHQPQPAQPGDAEGAHDRDYAHNHDEEIQPVEEVPQVGALLADEAHGDRLTDGLHHEHAHEHDVHDLEDVVPGVAQAGDLVEDGHDGRGDHDVHHGRVEARVVEHLDERGAGLGLGAENEPRLGLGHGLVLLHVLHVLLRARARVPHGDHKALGPRHELQDEEDPEHHEAHHEEGEGRDLEDVVLLLVPDVHREEVAREENEHVGGARELLHRVEERALEGLGHVGVDHRAHEHDHVDQGLLEGIFEDDLAEDHRDLLVQVDHLVVVVAELVELVQEAHHDAEVHVLRHDRHVVVAARDRAAQGADEGPRAGGAVPVERHPDDRDHADGVHHQREEREREELGEGVGVLPLPALHRGLRVEELVAVERRAVVVLERVLRHGEVAPREREEHARDALPEEPLEGVLDDDVHVVALGGGVLDAVVYRGDQRVYEEEDDPEGEDEVRHHELGGVVPPSEGALWLHQLHVEVEDREDLEPPRDGRRPAEVEAPERGVDLQVRHKHVERAEAVLELRQLDAEQEQDDEREQRETEDELSVGGALLAEATVAVVAVRTLVAPHAAVGGLLPEGGAAHAVLHVGEVHQARARRPREALEHGGDAARAELGVHPVAREGLGEALPDLVADGAVEVACEAVRGVVLVEAHVALAVGKLV
mmetsp:Transcript_6700/g.23347  ORF Transcript_6700/g.23347 Transcript_6700/m.23347 type:complete len:770 (+) Transcript_6700:330-2639(+)